MLEIIRFKRYVDLSNYFPIFSDVSIVSDFKDFPIKQFE